MTDEDRRLLIELSKAVLLVLQADGYTQAVIGPLRKAIKHSEMNLELDNLKKDAQV